MNISKLTEGDPTSFKSITSLIKPHDYTYTLSLLSEIKLLSNPLPLLPRKSLIISQCKGETGSLFVAPTLVELLVVRFKFSQSSISRSSSSGNETRHVTRLFRIHPHLAGHSISALITLRLTCADVLPPLSARQHSPFHLFCLIKLFYDVNSFFILSSDSVWFNLVV